HIVMMMCISLSYSCATQSDDKKENSVSLCTTLACRNLTWTDEFKHCGTFIHECGNYTLASIKNQYSLQGFAFQYDPDNSGSSTFKADREAFLNKDKAVVTHQLVTPPPGMSSNEFIELIRFNAKTYKAVAYWPYGPNSNSAADFPLFKSGAKTNKVEGALGLHHYHKDSDLDEIKNNAVRLFYEYASNKANTLISQIKNETLKDGSFKNLNIGDSKEVVINGLRNLQAYYISTQNNSGDGMIDLRANINPDNRNRLLSSDRWYVTYDDYGETFWFLQLDFDNKQLSEINIKSSGLELP
ncbi:MAG: hypothetical protein P8X88_00375, partial [Gammaproteobacteria bacterium]